LKFSQEELANRLGVSFASVNRWENDKSLLKGLPATNQRSYRRGGGETLVMRNLDAVDDEGKGRRRKAGHGSQVRSSARINGTDAFGTPRAPSVARKTPEIKDYILPLVFIKRLSDVFDDE